MNKQNSKKLQEPDGVFQNVPSYDCICIVRRLQSYSVTFAIVKCYDCNRNLLRFFPSNCLCVFHSFRTFDFVEGTCIRKYIIKNFSFSFVLLSFIRTFAREIRN